MRLILYSKPGCHLCEGLYEKLQQVRGISFELDVRDITTDDRWWQAYEYEIPVLVVDGEPPQRLPRLSPRGSVAQLEKMLQQVAQEHRE